MGADFQALWISLLAWLTLVGVGAVLAGALWWLLPRECRLLPESESRPLLWTGIDIWIAFFAFYVAPPAVYQLLRQTGLFAAIYGTDSALPLLRERELFWAVALALPLQVAIILGELHAVRGVRPAAVILGEPGVTANIVAGYLAWLALTPAALVVYWVVTLVLGQEPHVLEKISQQTLLPVEYVLLVVVAVGVAAVSEELVFRGLLLPWQVGRGPVSHVAVAGTALFVALLFGSQEDGFNPGPVLFVAAMLPGYALLPYLCRTAPPASEAAPAPAAPDEGNGTIPDAPSDRARGDEPGQASWLARYTRRVEEPRVNARLAIYGNALLFAAFHSSVWPSPIPLFLLGLGLAWLAWRTRGVVASMTTHALFNATACLVLFLL